MPENIRDIKRRTKSITNTRQITRAMQLVATSKMKRAQKKSGDADPFALGAWDILKQVTARLTEKQFHPFWEKNDSKKIGLILVTSDRGFCGGLNVTLLTKVLAFIKEQQLLGLSPEIVAVGRKGRDFFKKLGIPIIADFSGLTDHFTVSEITPIAHIATKDFLLRNYREIYIAYTLYINTITQKPIVRKILPMDIKTFEKIAELQRASPDESKQTAKAQYIYEPSSETVFKNLIPYLLEVIVYKAILEARASEHSARMVAMKNATDRAGEMIGDLKLAYNQARQAGITREIAEISAGRLAAK
ncbi:MAG: ATP synthase gamma chain [Parcubacteria group bacterium GW2011_GWA2_44_12]|nr:MAG: ATP synthase gamma chain [Parcubacteria group bacterium GW2011_GWA2_44_12]